MDFICQKKEVPQEYKEDIVLKRSYLLKENSALVAGVLKKSNVFDDEVKKVLSGDIIGRIYAAEKKRFNGADRFPNFSSAWVRGILGGVGGGVAGGVVGVLTYIGLFAGSIGLGAPIAIGVVLGALGLGTTAVLTGDPHTTVGRSQIGQSAFDDVMKNLQLNMDEFMALLIQQGYISKEYQDEKLDDVNIFTIWFNFFKFNYWFLEDFFCLGYVALCIQRAWKKGKGCAVGIADTSKHRSMEDAVRFGIAKYKGINMGEVQKSAGVWDGASNCANDLRYDILKPHMTYDDASYVEEVYGK